MADLYSGSHCIGVSPLIPSSKGSDRQHDWLDRSCLYRNMCLDQRTAEWKLFVPAASTTKLESTETPYITGGLVDVAPGAVNAAWSRPDKRSFRFKPLEVPGPIPRGAAWAPHEHPSLAAYANASGSSGAVWLLWHSMAAHNVGHLVWDDLIPLFTLPRLFGLGADALPLRLNLSQREDSAHKSCSPSHAIIAPPSHGSIRELLRTPSLLLVTVPVAAVPLCAVPVCGSSSSARLTCARDLGCSQLIE